MPLPDPIRIGTRASPLALAQARLVAEALRAAGNLPESAIAIMPLQTTGDRVQDRRLAEIGGKGLFTKEIERALAEGEVDLAVHSMKDLETGGDASLVVAALLPRADPRDVLIGADSVAGLPKGAVVGTASLRRQAQLLHLRPDLTIVPMRGNVGTRLRKLEEGQAAATLLARAGLDRLGLEPAGAVTLDMAEMLPAAAQGAVGVQARLRDGELCALLAKVDHATTRAEVEAERACLATLDGSCQTPIGALARLDAQGRLTLRARVLPADGSRLWAAEETAAAADAEALGVDIGRRLRAVADEAVFS